MKTDYLIIGQGLAGSLLAWELIHRNYHVIVVDNGQQNASLVAAGIINPVTGIRLALTPDIEVLLPAAHKFYAQLSEFFRQPFYHEMPMLRLFRNESERTYGNLRINQQDYYPYLETPDKQQPLMPEFNTPFGWIKQKQTGYLSIAALLNRLKHYLLERQAYRQDIVNHQEIRLSHNIRWQDITAKRIIFCEGYHSSQNPWFSWLPLQPAKGEILTIKSDVNMPNTLLNYGNWLLPSSETTVRIGATFDREYGNNLPTEQGKQALLMNLKSVNPRLAQNSQVLTHQAGIRPCTADRFPFIGKHPYHDTIMIFNGFGSKGGLQIPWHCHRFADYLQHNIPLPASCDIQRYQ
jgi:glycine/D-amino acid oxidase-like deaminating enzyme